jgi:hypothetical protein
MLVTGPLLSEQAMSDVTDSIQAVSAIVSTGIAAYAISMGVKAERRSAEAEQRALDRYREDRDLQEKIARANIRPFLQTTRFLYQDNRGVALGNAGLGTAAITSINFSRNREVSKCIPDLMDFDIDFHWDTFRRFGDERKFIAPGDSIRLVQLTKEKLLAQDISDADADAIMASCGEQLSEVEIRIEYTDMLDNPQPPLIDGNPSQT